MPLQFESISHGPIAFGFFNIETDIILLNQVFLFVNDFCSHLIECSESEAEHHEARWEVYQRFPFPAPREVFKQNLEGFGNRALIEKMVQKYSRQTSISFLADQRNERISIGQYIFSKSASYQLVNCIWVGGFPRWKDEIRPEYVVAMKKKLEQSKHPLFAGLKLE